MTTLINNLKSLHYYADPPAVMPLKGDAAHEVAVGPVHAGVIEPGHFRFQCVGEDVHNLQIFLGYQHRGVEEKIVRSDGNIARQLALAETCAGDSSIAAAIAFSELMEATGKSLAPSPRDRLARTILLELERIANHVGDLGALAGDVAFLPTASFCGRIRGDYLNLAALFCGNRFGRGAVVPGGLRIEMTAEKRQTLAERLVVLKKELDPALDLMFDEPTVLERFEGTGVVPKDVAAELGLVGVARRASDELSGDVLSRARVRRIEIDAAHERLADALAAWDAASAESEAAAAPTFPASIVATVDAWRGPLVHGASFDADGKMTAYKIVDPSARNWHALAHALCGEQISNFPICNKSFNLSYCGTDR